MSSLVETVTARSCSDAAIAPLVTSRRTRLSNLSLATNAVSVSVDMRGNETVSVTALDPATQSSFSTTAIPGLHNVATNWYNDGAMVSNVTESGVLAQVAYGALRRETARIDGRGNVSRTRRDAAPRNGDRHLVNNLQCREPSEECFRAGAIMAMIRIGVKNE